MKTIIIATILSAGVLLRPQMMPTAHDTKDYGNGPTTVTVEQIHSNSQVLQTSEMEALRGAGIVDCVNYFDTDGDYHEMCCLDLWLIRICGDLNVSAAYRLVEAFL